MIEDVEYVGFWARVGAALIDSILVFAVLIPLLYALFGSQYFTSSMSSFDALRDLMNAHDAADLFALLDKLSAQDAANASAGHGMLDTLINYLLPALAVVIFWLARQATPGKTLIGAKIVDAATGGPLKPGQALLRYVGYFVSTIPLGLGLLWVGLDARKQGWHDKIAGTLVVKVPRPDSGKR